MDDPFTYVHVYGASADGSRGQRHARSILVRRSPHAGPNGADPRRDLVPCRVRDGGCRRRRRRGRARARRRAARRAAATHLGTREGSDDARRRRARPMEVLLGGAHPRARRARLCTSSTSSPASSPERSFARRGSWSRSRSPPLDSRTWSGRARRRSALARSKSSSTTATFRARASSSRRASRSTRRSTPSGDCSASARCRERAASRASSSRRASRSRRRCESASPRRCGASSG